MLLHWCYIRITQQGRKVIHRYTLRLPHHSTFVIRNRQRAVFQLLYLFNQYGWQRIRFSAGRENHNLCNGKRQWQMNREVGALAQF